VSKIDENKRLVKRHWLHGHKNNICRIETNEALDIILSIDEDGLVLIH
jgi:hypothetical protein